MAQIVNLKDNNKNTVYPVTTMNAVYDSNGKNIKDVLDNVFRDEAKQTRTFFQKYRWDTKEWKGIEEIEKREKFRGGPIWQYNGNVYYNSYSIGADPTYEINYSFSYILDKSTSTWKPHSFGNAKDISGGSIWTDGENIYCNNYYTKDGSDNGPVGYRVSYILNKNTNTWEKKSWNGLTEFKGSNVWTDGGNIYYSDENKQYVLNKSTSTWEPKTWKGLFKFKGFRIWADGENIHYDLDNEHYILNKSTSEWVYIYDEKIIYGENVWTNGENIFYTDHFYDVAYIYNKKDKKWEVVDFGIKIGDGMNTWSDGKNIYFSGYVKGYNASQQYVLVKKNTSVNCKPTLNQY